MPQRESLCSLHTADRYEGDTLLSSFFLLSNLSLVLILEVKILRNELNRIEESSWKDFMLDRPVEAQTHINKVRCLTTGCSLANFVRCMLHRWIIIKERKMT
jgi:hypothetical protein